MGEQAKLEIKEYCKILNLKAVADNFEAFMQETASFEDYLVRLLQAQIDEKERKAIENRIKGAKFPQRKYLEDLELDCLPTTMRNKLPELASLDFIREGRNLILQGNPGTGKTHIATALGIKACEAGYKVLFTSVPYLVTELKESVSEKKLKRTLDRFVKYDLVIADELGYVSFDQEGSDLLFNCLSKRVGHKSTIITSNLSFKDWEKVFHGPAITGAMADRLTFRAIIVDMTGDSYRLREMLRINGYDPEYVLTGKSSTAAESQSSASLDHPDELRDENT